MEYVYTALRFSEWALEFIIIPPFFFAFVLAGISFVWAGQKQMPFQTHLWKSHHWFALTHMLFFAAAIVVGVVWANPELNPNLSHLANRSGELLLDVVTCGSLVSCVFWIWRMKGFRRYATSLMVLAELITFGAVCVAGMSVSGDWL
jgi:hypothetical protein